MGPGEGTGARACPAFASGWSPRLFGSLGDGRGVWVRSRGSSRCLRVGTDGGRRGVILRRRSWEDRRLPDRRYRPGVSSSTAGRVRSPFRGLPGLRLGTVAERSGSSFASLVSEYWYKGPTFVARLFVMAPTKEAIAPAGLRPRRLAVGAASVGLDTSAGALAFARAFLGGMPDRSPGPRPICGLRVFP